MRGQDLFGVILRKFGLILVFYGGWYLIHAATQYSGLPQQYPDEAKGYLASGIPSFLLGLTVLRRARRIVRLCYPGNRDDSDTDPQG